MKKVLIAVLLVVATMGICAQDKWYFSILPGYQFSTGDADSCFVASLDGGYFFTENYGLHFAYMYNEGKFKFDYAPYGEFKFEKNYNLIEIGPEFRTKAGEKGEIYGQLNVGYTFGSTGINENYVVTVGGTTYLVNVTGELKNDWALGAAFGYRYFFNKQVGLDLQATYHYLNGLKEGDFDAKNSWDARIGVTWRF